MSYNNTSPSEDETRPLNTTTSDDGLTPEKKETFGMKKQLGLTDGVGIIVGVIVGSGIFISPTGVIEYTGSVGMSLVVWAATGLLCIVGALCYAELGTMIPKSGGDYAYIGEAFGGLPAFLYLWVALVIIMPTGNAVIALTFANYILQPFFPYCDQPPDAAIRLIAALVICFLTWVNCVSIKAATKIQDVFSIAKIFALIIVICTGMYYLGTGHTENYKNAFEGTNWQVTAITTAFYQGFFSFAGWSYLNFVVEEIKDPYRNLPRAIMISLPCVTVVYFLTNVAYFAVLSPAEVLSSSAVAVTFGNRTLGSMAWIMPLFVACSTFGSLNGGIFTCSRLFFVGAREGHLPQSLALINTSSLTPIPSLIFLQFISLFMLISSDIQALINYTSFSEALFILISVTALLYFRYKEPDRYRPIKVWIGFPIFFFLVSLFLVVLPVIERPIELGVAVAVMLTGIPFYVFGVRRKSGAKCSSWMDKCTNAVQILTKGLPEEKAD